MERVGVGFTRGLSPTDMLECVKLAEELGYESAWMAEGQGGDQFSILTSWALATKKIKLGTCISSVFVRTAPTIAMAAASVDHFSDGRCILGLGSSHKAQVGPEHGVPFSQPLQHLREYVDIIRILLRDGEVSYQGKAINIQRFDFWFQPYRKEIPIVLGAVNPRMIQVCGEIAQGAMLVWSTLERTRMAAENIALGARSAGRDPKDVELSTLIACAVSDDKDEARGPMRNAVVTYAQRLPRYRRLMQEAGYVEEIDAVVKAMEEGDRERALRLVPNGLVDKISLLGSPEECREQLQEHRRAGITLPIIHPRASGENPKEMAMESIRACAPR
jgi:alkanesulfonate monooxygenase SsuD/methylene tetrahydromethanopterin reductase-like flavin-dependent oxidoreductase (luciferase family)